MKIKLIGLFALLIGASIALAETIPTVPEHYVNDYAGVLDLKATQRLNKQLAAFETRTTNQIVVAIYPTMDTDSSIEDYTNRIARSWKVGQKDKKNGVVLFVFVKAPNGKTKIRIETGYGLEGALPDVTAYRIIQDDIIPHIALAKKNNDSAEWSAAIQAGINSIMKATQAEYKPAVKKESASPGSFMWILVTGIILCLVLGAIWTIVLKFRKEEEKEESELPSDATDVRFNVGPILPPTKRKSAGRRTTTKTKSEESDNSGLVTGAILGSMLSSRDEDTSSSSSKSTSNDDDDSPSFSSGGGDFGGGGASGEV